MNQPMRPQEILVEAPVTLTAIVRPEVDGGFSASVPALPGCHTQGETLEEIRANLREAAEGWLSVAHDEGASENLGPPPCEASNPLRF